MNKLTDQEKGKLLLSEVRRGSNLRFDHLHYRYYFADGEDLYGPFRRRAEAATAWMEFQTKRNGADNE